VDEWNKGFSDIFTQKHAEDIPFSFATAERPGHPRVGMEVHPRILEEDTPEAKQQAEREQARKICSIIRNRVAAHRGASPLKIAVLARARMHLPVLLDEFRTHSIRYRALDIDALGDMQEVRDVVALTRCLLHPSDRIAWLAVLRAPWSGLMLADLHALCQGDDPSARDACVGEMLEQDLSALTPEGRTRCTRVREVLRAALSARNRISVAALVERTWHSLGGPACAAPQQRENIERYFQFLQEVERDNALNDFRALEDLLARFFAIPQSFNPGETVVDVLTIHGAKGLEWDIVFVPELQRKGASDNSQLLNWIEYPALEQGVVLAAAGAADASEDLFYRWFCSKRGQQHEAERKRLFYVACTRAREELHLFGTLSLKEDGEPASPHFDSLLATGWPMLESQFLQAASKKRAAVPPIGSNLLLFPSPTEAVQGILPALAATATDVVQLNQRRLPTGWRPPAVSKPLTWTRAASPTQETHLPTPFVRAEGSILARTTGDAIHRFLEKITRDFAAGMTLPEIEARVSAKTIASVVRALGVSPDAQRAISAAVSAAIERTLRDPVAHWLLGPRKNAITEAAISAETQGVFRNARVDRAFLAGDAPNSAGEDTLWLVDYKTGESGRAKIEEFLLEQQLFYSPQLTTYARLLRPLFPQASKIRLGLYFPSLGRLQHWNWSEESEQP
jgi:ATP-dependent exoDNAse (exonuclease V) beta subunit